MLVLESPAYLLLLIFVPVLIYFRHLYAKRGGRLLFPFSIYKGEDFHSPVTIYSILLACASILFWIGYVLLIFCLAGPVRIIREPIDLTRGADIMIVLDQSASMAVQDFQFANRFDTARFVIQDFIQQRVHDHIGLVGFSAEAALRVPPTQDYDYLLNSLDSMQLLELGDGTAIGMGIAVAALHLQNSSAVKQAIILLTDGVNNAGEISPETAASVAANVGIRIYAIGVGSKREAFVEVTDENEGRVYRGKVRDGYDEEILQKISSISGGRYYTADSLGTLQTIFDVIASAENVQRRVRVEVKHEPAHQEFLLIAIACFVACPFIRVLFSERLV